jgi:H+/Cl- antiporter ClcA
VRHHRGLIGAAYLAVLDLVRKVIGPSGWSPDRHMFVLIIVGIAVACMVRWMGRPADVELLVDNIHVPDGTGQHAARLRSLLPISLLCIGAGGTLGPEAPLVTTTETFAHRHATRVGLRPVSPSAGAAASSSPRSLSGSVSGTQSPTAFPGPPTGPSSSP